MIKILERNFIKEEINRGIYESLFKIIFAMFIILFALCFFSLNVYALGISPGRTTIDYEPGLEKQVEISIINNEHKSMKVALFSMMRDDLNGSINLFEDHLEFLPSEKEKILNYEIKLPEEMGPGLHKGEIVAVEVPSGQGGETSVGATIAVVSQLHIYVPYPGKFVEADLNILDATENSTATFIVPVTSRGKLGIGEVRAVIDIYKLGEKITTLETDHRSLDSGKRTELSSKWKVDVSQGDYLAKVTVFYDGESIRFEKPFTVGEKKINVESILVNDFQLGEIAKLRILVENKWSQELESVFANLLIYNKQEQIMADVKSSSESIPALSKKELVAYWDTVGVKEGEYEGKLMVKYGEKASEKDLILKVSQDNLDIVGLGYAIRKKPKGISLTTILIILIAILVIANISWFVILRRFLGKKKKKKNVKI